MENITVCVRIKPRIAEKNDENLWKIEGNNILSLKSKEIFTYGKLILFYLY